MFSWNRKWLAIVHCTSNICYELPSSQVTGFSPFQMVHSKPPPDKLAFDYDPTKSGIKVDTPLYMLFIEQGKLPINQMIMRRKKYEAESQLIRKSRKYQDAHRFGFNKSLTKLCIEGPIQKIEKRLGRLI